MSNATKLLVSAVTLSIVMILAAVEQRRHKPPVQAVTVATEGTRERKVFGEVPAPTQAVPEPVIPAEPAQDADIPGDIAGLLERWRSSMQNKDVDTHLETYAFRLDRFFRKRRVSRQTVRREKEQMLRIYPDVNKYDIRDIKLESRRGPRAVVTFTKDWDMSGVRRFAGSERQRLTLHKAGERWQITGEEELKLYWVSR